MQVFQRHAVLHLEFLFCPGGIGADRAALDGADRNGVVEPVDPGDLSGLVLLRLAAAPVSIRVAVPAMTSFAYLFPILMGRLPAFAMPDKLSGDRIGSRSPSDATPGRLHRSQIDRPFEDDKRMCHLPRTSFRRRAPIAH